MNLNINNAKEKITIDLFGEIGESWFSEGITMNDVKNALNEASGKDIELRVSSLGGDLNHALVIHDLLKMHKGNVEAKIVGATASSGTVVALGADKILMSENALFLIHNSSKLTHGNAEEHRSSAEMLDRFDDRLVAIYRKKTGNAREDILDLMKEERFIDSAEAADLGFVDEVFVPEAVAAKITEKKKTEILNKINCQMKFEKITNTIEVEELVITDDGVFLNEQQLQSIEDKLEAAEGEAQALTDLKDEKEAADQKVADLETDVQNVQGKVTELEEGNKTILDAYNENREEGKAETVEDVVAAHVAEIEAQATKIADLESQVAKKGSRGLNLIKNEPDLEVGKNEKLSDRDKQHKRNAKTIVGEIDKFTSVKKK